MEVVSNGVVDESALRLGLAACLVSEHNVIIPSPFEREIGPSS